MKSFDHWLNDFKPQPPEEKSPERKSADFNQGYILMGGWIPIPISWILGDSMQKDGKGDE